MDKNKRHVDEGWLSCLLRGAVLVGVASGLIYSIHVDLPKKYDYFKIKNSERVVDGELYGTCQPIEKLIKLNHMIRPTLARIAASPYFRTFKVNMERECPFWAQQRLCNSDKCSVCECEKNDVPSFWDKKLKKDKKVQLGRKS